MGIYEHKNNSIRVIKVLSTAQNYNWHVQQLLLQFNFTRRSCKEAWYSINSAILVHSRAAHAHFLNAHINMTLQYNYLICQNGFWLHLKEMLHSNNKSPFYWPNIFLASSFNVWPLKCCSLSKMLSKQLFDIMMIIMIGIKYRSLHLIKCPKIKKNLLAA